MESEPVIRKGYTYLRYSDLLLRKTTQRPHIARPTNLHVRMAAVCWVVDCELGKVFEWTIGVEV